jgi:hypothetical protein
LSFSQEVAQIMARLLIFHVELLLKSSRSTGKDLIKNDRVHVSSGVSPV